MGTMHEDVALDQAKDWLKDPEGQKALINIFEGFMEGRWSQEYIRAIGQDYRLEPRQWPIEQICSFALMHSYLMEGILRSVQIGVGETLLGTVIESRTPTHSRTFPVHSGRRLT